MHSMNSSLLEYHRPPLLRTQCSTSTSLLALTRMGVPTASASSASRDRLS